MISVNIWNIKKRMLVSYNEEQQQDLFNNKKTEEMKSYQNKFKFI